MEYEILMLPPAENDLADIAAYLNSFSRDAALRIYSKIVDEIESLSSMPLRCPQVRDPLLAAKGYRYLIVEKYLVFFMAN